MALCSWRKPNKVYTIGKNKDTIFDTPKSLKVFFQRKVTPKKYERKKEANHSIIESLRALRPFFRYNQLLGIMPLSINAGDTGLLMKHCSPLWIFTGISLSVQTTMVVRAVLMIIQDWKTNNQIAEEVKSVHNLVLMAHGFLMTLIMVSRSRFLPGFIDSCHTVENICRKYTPSADNLVKVCWILFGLFVCSRVVGNGLYMYAKVGKYNVTSVVEYAESFELEEEHTSGVGFLYIILEIHGDFVWTFGDVFIALVALIITRFFVRVNKGICESAAKTVVEIESLRRDHQAVKDLVELFNHIFSPTILVNFVFNIMYLLARLYTGVFADLKHENIIVRIECVYAFVYPLLKILVPIYIAALLNEQGYEALNTIHGWPSLISTDECEQKLRIMVINRFVSQIVNYPPGFTGCNCFTITKGFLCTVVSLIITYEVVILQFQQAANQSVHQNL